jgi:hypothetical protein
VQRGAGSGEGAVLCHFQEDLQVFDFHVDPQSMSIRYETRTNNAFDAGFPFPL